MMTYIDRYNWKNVLCAFKEKTTRLTRTRPTVNLQVTFNLFYKVKVNLSTVFEKI